MPVSMSGSPTSPKKGGSPPKTERDVAYDELRTSRLVMKTEAEKKAAATKKKAKDEFAARQAEMKAVEAAEKERVATYRKEALEKPTLGSPLPPWAGLHKTSPIKVDTNSRPTHWGKLDEQEASRLMRTVTKAATARAVRSADSRKQEAAEAKAAALAEQKQQEAAALAMRQAQRDKAAAEKAATLTKAKQIQKEMAAECKKQQKDAEAKAKVRYEKAKVEREEMIKKLKMDTKLRDEDEIANERREGSSMSKGGKADFEAAAKTTDGVKGSEF